jgi:hypothetical protein
MRQNAWKYWMVSGGLVIAGYFALPGAASQDIVCLVMGVASLGAILIGTVLHRPQDRLGWYLLALGTALFIMGDAAENAYRLNLHQAVPFPSVGNYLYLAGYPFLFAGIIRLTRGSNRAARREANTDAAIMALAGAAVWWQFLVNSYVHDGSLVTSGKLVTLAYPVLDVVLVFIVFRALLFGRAIQPFHALLALAFGSVFVSGFVYDLLVRYHTYATGNAVDALVLAQYVLVGAAALHPSMAEAPVPTPAQRANIYVRQNDGRHRIPLVAFAGFVPPSMLLVTICLGASVDVPVMAASASGSSPSSTCA